MPEMQAYYLDTTVGDDLENVIPMTANDLYPAFFPGYVGQSADNLPCDAFTPHDLGKPESMDAQGQHINYDMHGEMGEVNRNSYAILGPVEPNLVEDFQLYGNVAAGQRRPEYGVGPVGQYDHGEYTMLQVAQQMSPEAYAEQSLISLLAEGI